MEKYIHYGHQLIDEDDIQAVVDTLRGDYLTTGPKIQEFEKALCEVTGAKYCVVVSNGTAALHAACFAAGITKEDEVITTPMTFAASANCALYVGARPVFADICPDTYNIDPQQIEKNITNKTRAIIPVHFTGQPCDMDAITKIAKKNNLIVIEDAAHALGAKYNNKKIGSISDMTTFSFHPVKHITTGEGGAVTTNDESLYQKLLLFRSHGITRNPELMNKNEGGWYYEQLELGYNYRMTDIQAALGISQLKKLQLFIEKRRHIVEKYNHSFNRLEYIKIPKINKKSYSSWHLYVIKIAKELSRKKVYDKMQELGIGVNVHYVPVYKHPYYQKLGYKSGLCPAAEELYEKMITLPIHHGMNDEDIERVINAVSKINSLT